MIVLLSVLAAAIPTGIYVALIYWVDRYEKEPIWLLSAAFLWGAIPSIIAAFIINTVLGEVAYLFFGPETADVIGAAIIAPPVEETLKGIALVGIFYFWHKEIDSWLDGIVYGAMVGMGFAMVENVYYFLNVYNAGGLGDWQVNIFMRAVIFGLNHSLFTSFTGMGLAISRLGQKRWHNYAPLFGWSLAVFSHFLHNLSASLGDFFCLILPINAWGGVMLIIVIIIWALAQEHSWLVEYLKEEVVRGNMTLNQYYTVCSSSKRYHNLLRHLFHFDFKAYRNLHRFYYLCSKLAYKKHHRVLFRDPKTKIEIGLLRQEIRHANPLIIDVVESDDGVV